MQNWSTVLDIIEAGLVGDSAKVRAYAELLLANLEKEGTNRIMVKHLRKILQGESPGQVIHFAEDIL